MSFTCSENLEFAFFEVAATNQSQAGVGHPMAADASDVAIDSM